MAFTRDLDNLIPIMTSNTAPSGFVASASSAYDGSGTYDAYKCFTGSIGDRAFTSPSTPRVGWFRIQFPTAKTVNKYLISCPSEGGTTTLCPKNWTFKGSNNGTDWTVLDTQTGVLWASAGITKTYIFSNTTAYLYYELNVTSTDDPAYGVNIGELELCATGQYASLIPVMTSNTAPSGYIVSASSEYGYADNYYAWKAADGTLSAGLSTWTTAPIGTTTGWWQIQLPTEKVVKCYSIQTQDLSGYENRGPRDFTFLGSSDGVNFTTLDTQTGITFFRATANTFLINNNTAYKYYRINVTANNGGNVLAIGELRMFGTDFEIPRLCQSIGGF